MSLHPLMFPFWRRRWLFTSPRRIATASVLLPTPEKTTACFMRKNSGITPALALCVGAPVVVPLFGGVV